MSVTARSGADEESVVSVMTLGWTLKRALIGVAILIAFVTGAALLFEAAVESDVNAAQAAIPAKSVVH